MTNAVNRTGDAYQLNDTNIHSADLVLNQTDVIDQTNKKYVELKLADLEDMVLEYLDENLPPADNNTVEHDGDDDDNNDDSDGHVMERSLGHNLLFNRLRKFAERYIHPDISKAVTATGRVFLLKGNYKWQYRLRAIEPIGCCMYRPVDGAQTKWAPLLNQI